MRLGLIKRAIEICKKNGIIALLFATIHYLRLIPRQVYRKYAFSRLQHLYYRLQHNSAAPNPNEIIFIDPNEVNYLITPRFRELCRWGTYVRGGDWDNCECDHHLMLTSKYHMGGDVEQRCLVSFDKYGLYNSSKKHFSNEVPWDQTKFHEWLESNSHPDISKYKTQRFQKFDKLYEQIDSVGYLSQKSLGKQSILEKHLTPSDEVLINIGRNGEIFLDDGRHRLIIAMLLNIDLIPVRVLVRHEQWQQKRQYIASGTANTAEEEHFNSHPDVQLLVSD